MKRLMNFKWSVIVMILFFIVGSYMLSLLPADARIPSHVNIRNEIDGWSSKTGTMLFGGGMMIFLFAMFFLMPWYSPWYRNYEHRNEKIIPTLCFIMILFFALLLLFQIYLAIKNITDPPVQIMLILIGLLFISLGNLLPKMPKNFFIGIKTPWTLTSEDNWIKTHRLGGTLFVISGLIMIIKGFFPKGNMTVQIVTTLIAIGMLLYPMLYSFMLYRKENK